MWSRCTATKSSPRSPQLEKSHAQQWRPNAAKKKEKPQLHCYWITKQCVSENTLRVLKRVQRKMLCMYSTAAGILVKGDTDPKLFEWLLWSQARGRRRIGKLGKLHWPGEGWGQECKMKGQKRQHEWDRLQMCCWGRPPILSFHVSNKFF